MSADQKGFIVYKDLHAVVDELTDEQAGQLFKGMIGYFSEGAEPKFDGVLKFVFIPIKQQMDRDSDKYEARCEKNRENANKRWSASKDNTNAYERIRMDAKHANTNTNTNTNTKTDTDTKTTTNTNTNDFVVGGGSDCDDEFNIWKRLSPDDIDAIYDVYPESGGFLLDAVYQDVKTKKKSVKDPVKYVLGYAKNVGWDDSAQH